MQPDNQKIVVKKQRYEGALIRRFQLLSIPFGRSGMDYDLA